MTITTAVIATIAIPTIIIIIATMVMTKIISLKFKRF